MKKTTKKQTAFTKVLLFQAIINTKLPSISRFIPDRTTGIASNMFFDRVFFLNFITGVILMIVVLQIGVVSKTFVQYQSTMERQVHTEETIAYWKTVVNKYPDYRDGYFRLSILSYQLGKDDDAKIYLQKVFALDPNFSGGDELAMRLGMIK